MELTSSNHSRLVLLISDLFLLDVSTREEKPHHSFEELVHELDGERHHVHLMKHRVDVKTPDTDFTASAGTVTFHTSKCSFTEIPPTGGRTLLKMRKANWRPNWQLLWGRRTTWKKMTTAGNCEAPSSGLKMETRHMLMWTQVRTLWKMKCSFNHACSYGPDWTCTTLFVVIPSGQTWWTHT